MKSAIAVLGTGRMGSALASAFVGQQHPTHVFNRTRSRSEPLRAKGAILGGSVAEAVSAAQAVFVCVSEPVLASASNDLMARTGARRYAADETTLASLEAHHGAFPHLREICMLHGMENALPSAFGRLFDLAMAQGHGGDDFTVLHRFMQAPRRAE